MKGIGKRSEILRNLNEKAGYDPEEEIALYEVGFNHLTFYGVYQDFFILTINSCHLCGRC